MGTCRNFNKKGETVFRPLLPLKSATLTISVTVVYTGAYCIVINCRLI